ncbi:MAG: hypothetical protein WC322_00220 [Candidatus Paceibacterota bacterium]
MTDLVSVQEVQIVSVPETTVQVIEAPSETRIIAECQQGPEGKPGPVGPAGGAAFIRYTSSALSALRVVWEDVDGAVYPIDPEDDAHIDLISGLTLTATPGAGEVTVQRSGPVDDSAWSWAPGRVWLGAAGALTQTPPLDGTDVLIGYAVSPTRLFLDIQDPIFQED